MGSGNAAAGQQAGTARNVILVLHAVLQALFLPEFGVRSKSNWLVV